jgi:hypothetical protein
MSSDQGGDQSAIREDELRDQESEIRGIRNQRAEIGEFSQSAWELTREDRREYVEDLIRVS